MSRIGGFGHKCDIFHFCFSPKFYYENFQTYKEVERILQCFWLNEDHFGYCFASGLKVWGLQERDQLVGDFYNNLGEKSW